uniref:Cyclic nucleotide-binding domain-containing protein n=1 Tax=Hemiselmis andersenii TaxID=464988 RepID=A0A6U4NED1_HEMAN|mmetsp:Transcript_11143/g.25814  ORF Transcript_11143/g.25814 Transcript_11143/m.25814 type:complete len:359 (-) Transcript_11143:54-1130(-)
MMGGHHHREECDEEHARVSAVRSLGCVEDHEEELGVIARLATGTFSCPNAFITMVTEDKEVVVALDGPVRQREYDREAWFGHHIISKPGREPLVVPDTAKDPRFSGNPAIAAANVRFYAGAPLFLCHMGVERCIGTLCVMDENPRGLEEGDTALMMTLATACVREMECLPQRRDGAMTPSTEDGYVMQRVKELKSHAPFARRSVDEGCIKLFAEKLRPRIVHSGHCLTRVGDVADTLYFIARGTCICTLNGVELERLTAGHCFGETSLLRMCKLCTEGKTAQQAKQMCTRNADVIALERCELLELHFDDAQPLLKKAPNLWFTLEDMAKRRLESVNRVERSQTASGVLGRAGSTSRLT